ncbi:MAG: acyltransferase [Rhodobiaceae bacterium]|nr:acyltransferase [Rhodobiaceae bacterium]
MAMDYRSDIDGLRAVAVVPVILFHAGYETFSGGFVGVDVFFVISGYLMANIFVTELSAGKFSLVRFYERRVRRIIPALVFVVTCTMPLAWILLLPNDFSAYAESIIHTFLFANNIYLYDHVGYFDRSIDLLPLMHTWSLSVEEQYYIFAPVVSMLVWPLGLRIFTAGATLALLVSLAACLFFAEANPRLGFYMPFTRVWELQVGALCAIWHFRFPRRGNSYLGFAGLALIICSVIGFDATTPFPSLFTVVPVAGAAAIILFSDKGMCIHRVLSLKPLTVIGIISYSAYLWHQPLFAFARVASIEGPSHVSMSAIAALSLILAYGTWRYVEQPFRKASGSIVRTPGRLFSAAAMAVAALVAFAVVVTWSDGFRNRPIARNSQDVETRMAPYAGLGEFCNGNNIGEADFLARCATGKDVRIALWGDSYAMQMAQVFIESDGFDFVQLTKPACAPLEGIAFQSREIIWGRECISHNERTLEFIAGEDSVDVVVIVSPFTGLRLSVLLADGTRLAPGDHTELGVNAFAAAVQRIRAAGKRVVFISPVPSNGKDIGKCVVGAMIYKLAEDFCDFHRSGDATGGGRAAFMRQVEGFVPILSLDAMICPDDVCDTYRDGVLMYRDEGHLTKEGSGLLGRLYGLSQKAFEVAR